MIEFYYTGAQAFQGEQKDPLQSLGGFISSSKIPNKLAGNLFLSISDSTIERGSEETFCIGLKNIGPNPINSMVLSLDLPVDAVIIGDLSGFLILPTLDDCERVYFERIPSRESIPTFGDLRPLSTTDTISVTFPTPLEVGSYVGLWLHRVIPQTLSSSNDLHCKDCDTLHKEFLEGKDTTPKKEIYPLKFVF